MEKLIIKLKPGSAKWSMFNLCSKQLITLFWEFVGKAEGYGCDRVIITSIIRPKTNDSGIHALGRAIDISAIGIPDPIGKNIVEYINNKYVYDINRPELQSVIFHKSNSTEDKAFHFHLQVI